MKLRFTEAWPNAVSPISMRFESGIDLKLRFTEPWPNAVSPIRLRFSEPVVPEPPRVITKQYAIGWRKPLIKEFPLIVSYEISQIESKKQANWLLEPLIQANYDWYWNLGPLYQVVVNSIWSIFSPHVKVFSICWGEVKALESMTVVAYDKKQLYVVNQIFPWSSLDFVSSSYVQQWEIESTPQYIHIVKITTSKVVNSHHYLAWGPHKSSWQCSDNYRPPVGSFSMRFSDSWANARSPIVLRFVKSPMVCEYDDGGGLIDASPVLPPLDFEVPIEPQIRRAYLMQPIIDCIRVSDNRRIVVNSVSLSHSRGHHSKSVSIEFSSRIDAENAENELLKLSLNGYDFYFICEDPAENMLFGSHSFSSSGRGRSAELAAPYELSVSYTNSTARSFGGILSDLVQYSDWSVSLVGVNDFTVPANVFSTSGKSPIEAINDAVDQIGCMVLSDDENQVLSIVPKWPTVPWSMQNANPDITLHDAVIFSHSKKDSHQVLCNSVWIRGEQQGVSRQVKRAGSAGDINTSDISEQLIVGDEPARVAASMALADTGKKRVHNMTLPIMVDLAPLSVGMLVGVREGAALFKSVCDSWRINASVSEQGDITIEQVVTVIESLE